MVGLIVIIFRLCFFINFYVVDFVSVLDNMYYFCNKSRLEIFMIIINLYMII